MALIDKKIKAFENDLKEGMVWNTKKHHHKLVVLQWLKKWLMCNEEERKQCLLTIGNISSPPIATMTDLMNFLEKTKSLKKNLFASLWEGVGATEGLLRACAIYLDHQKLVDVQTGNVVYPAKPIKSAVSEKTTLTRTFWPGLKQKCTAMFNVLFSSPYKKLATDESSKLSNKAKSDSMNSIKHSSSASSVSTEVGSYDAEDLISNYTGATTPLIPPNENRFSGTFSEPNRGSDLSDYDKSINNEEVVGMKAAFWERPQPSSSNDQSDYSSTLTKLTA